jgi:hypothetical protein
MKIRTTKAYLHELAEADRRYHAMQEKVEAFARVHCTLHNPDTR